MRALVLSGGGAKGAYQVGALKRLMAEHLHDYKILCGVSVGALNVAALSMVPHGNPREAWAKLSSFWSGLDTSKVYKKRILGIASGLWNDSIYDSTPLIERVRRELDVRAIAASGRMLRVGAVCLETGEYRTATENEQGLADWVLASSSFPCFLKPMRIEGRMWSDGGLRNVTPLGEAIKLGADEIDVVLCSNPDMPNVWNANGQHAFPGYALRALDIMADEIVRTDLEVAGLKNDLSQLRPEYRNVRIRIIQPSAPLPSDSLDFSPGPAKMMHDLGYEDAGMLRGT